MIDKKTKKKSFIFNVEWQEILLAYPAEVRLEVYDAIVEYVVSGTFSELKPMAKMAFSFIKKEIDENLLHEPPLGGSCSHKTKCFSFIHEKGNIINCLYKFTIFTHSACGEVLL